MSTNTYTPVVGIEIHVELATKSKMFCSCKNDPFYASEPNIYTCPVCLGMPGALPVANKQAIEWTMKIGLALGCEINLFSKFDRKHYFYPDLPKGYQISQYDQPLCVNGLVKTEFGDVRITRVHLEEDTGKLVHHEVNGTKVSLVDFNRSSVPLVEIVTEPDIHSPEQAKAYAKKIAQLIRFLEVSSADMEKGSMRLEANISVQTKDEQASGTLPPYKVEVKNLNSFRYIERAIAFEVARHSELRDEGTIPTQETRGWNEAKNHTFPQRTKESAEDYRYFPDPDLPPLVWKQEAVDTIKASLPELPDTLIKRWVDAGMKASYAEILSETPEMARFADLYIAEANKRSIDPSVAITLFVNKKITPKLPITRDGAILQDIIDDLFIQIQTATTVDAVSDEEIKTSAQLVIEQQPKAVADYKNGKTQVIGFLMGMVNKQLGKKIDPGVVKAMLEQLLS